MTEKQTDFGFQTIAEADKVKKVADVFDSVATRYDVMNDLMSGGMHRLWKTFTLARVGARTGMRVLDIAGGTGDLAKSLARTVGPTGQVWLTDINLSMLNVGRDRMIDAGLAMPYAVCDAQSLPFPTGYFDRVTVAFGLRNMTHKDVALAEMTRVLKPGGKLCVLEFSRINKRSRLPTTGTPSTSCLGSVKKVAKDEASYRYLAESIRMHPDQETLKTMMQEAGLSRVQYFNLTAGVVALHEGVRLG